jgi:hypothetical protein
VSRALAAAAALAGAMFLVSPSARAQGEPDNGVETAPDEPAFPGPLRRDAVRVWSRTFFAPAADVGDADVTLIRPELRLRARLPVDDRASLQVTAGFAASHYDVDGSASMFADCPTCPVPDDLYAASLGIQGGYLINTTGYLLRSGEQWAVLAAAFGRARWETGAFDDSVTAGGSTGLGYKLPRRLRIALGVRVESSLDGGASIGPMGDLRWDITDTLRLRNRSLGLQLEYKPTKRLELFATGFRSSDRFRLDARDGAPSDLTWSDRHVLVGGGFEWKVGHRLRISTEAGAIVDRRIAVDDDDGTLDSVSGDPSPYVELRLEVRP